MSFGCGEWQNGASFFHTNETMIIFYVKLPTQNEQKKYFFHNKRSGRHGFILLKLSNFVLVFDMVTVGQRGHLIYYLRLSWIFCLRIDKVLLFDLFYYP